MKKVVKVLCCVALCFSFCGCFTKLYTRDIVNGIECENCKSVTDIASLTYNVENVMNSVDAVKIDYTLTNTKKTFNIYFEAITKEKRIDWDLYAKTNIDGKDILFYFKDTKFYFIYPNNGANVILKDDITTLVAEAELTLDELNATYNKNNLENMFTGDKLSGFDFEAIREKGTYVTNKDGTYTINFVGEDGLKWQIDISSDYLVSEIRCKAINFNSTMTFDYPDNLSITYPMGLDFLTLDIKEAKDVLKVDSFAEVFDEDLKEKSE